MMDSDVHRKGVVVLASVPLYLSACLPTAYILLQTLHLLGLYPVQSALYCRPSSANHNQTQATLGV